MPKMCKQILLRMLNPSVNYVSTNQINSQIRLVNLLKLRERNSSNDNQLVMATVKKNEGINNKKCLHIPGHTGR